MASLNASGIPVVTKRNIGLRSYGRHVVVTDNLNPFGQDSARSATISGVPVSERTLASFGTQSSPAIESFLKSDKVVKHTNSLTDSVTNRVSGSIPPGSGTQPEIALIDITVLRQDHRGDRIVEQNTLSNSVVKRTSNAGTTPGSEI